MRHDDSSEARRRRTTALRVGVGAALLIAASGCRCNRAEVPPAPVLVAGHYDEFDVLVRAAAQGRRDVASQVARDLTEGEPVRRAGAAGERAAASLGAALGFLVVGVDDVEDLADGVASAAAACGDCHREAGASTRDARPPFTHVTADHWAVWGSVWGDVREPPEGTDAQVDEAVTAWRAPLSEDTGAPRDETVRRLSRFLARCAACHAAAPEPTRTPGSP